MELLAQPATLLLGEKYGDTALEGIALQCAVGRGHRGCCLSKAHLGSSRGWRKPREKPLELAGHHMQRRRNTQEHGSEELTNLENEG